MKKFIIGILIIVLGIVLLNIQDNHIKKNAISRCGNEDNIVEHYTEQGDKYFSCKVEK